jgi:hypothetical protein
MESDDDKQRVGGTAAAGEAHGDSPGGSRRAAAARSFVVQVAAGCDPAEQSFSGRVHHLATSDGGNFDSLDSFLAILQRVLGRSKAPAD